MRQRKKATYAAAHSFFMQDFQKAALDAVLYAQQIMPRLEMDEHRLHGYMSKQRVLIYILIKLETFQRIFS